ncbi:MAG: phasin family protein [Candidatus Firestonebacteria bacterium]
MDNIFRKAFLAGLGAVALTEKAGKKLLKELVKKGAVSEKEAGKIIKEVVKKAKKEKKDLANKIVTETKKIVEKASVKAIEGLNKLEKELSKKDK